jgi:hypothetical protein
MGGKEGSEKGREDYPLGPFRSCGSTCALGGRLELAVYLLDERVAVLVALLVLADPLELLQAEAAELARDLIDGQSS